MPNSNKLSLRRLAGKLNACRCFLIIVFIGLVSLSGFSSLAQCPPVILTNDTVYCSGGQPAVLNASGAATYSWSPTTSLYWTTGPSVLAYPSVTTTYTVVGTTTSGCTGSATAVVTVKPSPTVTASPNPAISCEGDTLTLTASGAVSYTWSPSFNLNTTVGSSVQITPTFNMTYVVTGTAANGCTGVAVLEVTQGSTPQVTLTGVSADCGPVSGAIGVQAFGGSQSFEYLWSNGATTQSIDDLDPGPYSVTVMDVSGCSNSASTVVGSSVPPTVSVDSTGATCGLPNGSIALSVTGGVPPYAYAWSNGATTSSIINLPGGVYVYTVTDANSCNMVDSVTVTDAGVPDITAIVTNSTCQQDNGAIDVQINGGTSSLTYAWSGGQTVQDLFGVGAGTYYLTVTDAIGCTDSAAVAVATTSSPTPSAAVTDASCDLQNGSIDLSVTGGTGGYTFLWENGEVTEDRSALAAGAYSVTVTDSLGCSAALQSSVGGSDALSLITVVTDATCVLDNGAIDLQIDGGTAPYLFNWTMGQQPVEDLYNLAAGTYDVTVSDVDGCTATATATVSALAVSIVSANVVHTTCASANGSIDVTVTGAPGPYTFVWDNGVTDEDRANLAAGDYDLTVTDQNACDNVATYTVNPSLEIVLSATTVDAACGASNGSVDLTVTNGTPPVGYNWGANGTTEDLSNVAAGDYNVTVTDANQCSAALLVTVSNPNAPALTLTATDASCQQINGFVDATVNGGSTPYAYTWSNGGTEQDLLAIDSGVYTLTVTDANGCSAMETANVTTTSVPVIEVSVTHEVCNAADGAVDVTVTNVTSSTFAWSPNGETTEDLLNVVAATYTVVVTADNGCTADTTVTVNSIQCAPTVTLVAADASCGQNNGSIDLTISGGTGPFEYNWDNAQTTEDASGLAAGLHYVTVTDAAGTATVYSAIVNGPAPPTLTVSQQDEACDQSNGSITPTVDGGTGPFTFLWSNMVTTPDLSLLQAGTYAVTVTDDDGCTASASATLTNLSGPSLSFTTTNAACNQAVGAVDLTVTDGTFPFQFNWNNAYYTEDLVNVPANTYNATVTDVNGCSATVTAVVVATDAPTVSITTLSSTCGSANGSATATASGGMAPYDYSWTVGGGETAGNLLAGNYCVTVTDAIGCTVSACANVDNVAGPAIDIATTPEICYQANGEADASVAGTAPFTFQWQSGQTTEDLDNLVTGNYALTVTDANGCTANQSVLVDFLSAPEIQSAVTAATCNLANGLVDITVTGTAPFTFQWSNSTQFEDAANLAAGSYAVTVTDVNGCTALHTADVAAIEPGVVLLSGVPQSICAGQSFTANASGMTSYAWNPAMQLNTATGSDVVVTPFVATTYTVTGTDDNGCTHSVEFTVDPMALPLVAVPYGPYVGCSPYSVQLDADTSNAVSILWHFGNGFSSTDVAPTFDFSPGVYTATIYVVSAEGCADTVVLPQLVTVDLSPTAQFKVMPAVPSQPENPAMHFTFYNLSSHASSFVWTFGDTSAADYNVHPDHLYDDYGTYTVTLIATSDNGCVDTAQYPLTVEEPRLFFIPNTFTPNNDGANDVFELYGRNVASYQLHVYDRLGEEVYSGNQDSAPWDGTLNGKPLNTGVFVYWVEVVFNTGRTARRHGDVTLLR